MKASEVKTVYGVRGGCWPVGAQPLHRQMARDIQCSISNVVIVLETAVRVGKRRQMGCVVDDLNVHLFHVFWVFVAANISVTSNGPFEVRKASTRT